MACKISGSHKQVSASQSSVPPHIWLQAGLQLKMHGQEISGASLMSKSITGFLKYIHLCNCCNTTAVRSVTLASPTARFIIDRLQSAFMCLCVNPPPSGSEADTVLSESSVSNHNICCHRPRLSSSVCVKAQTETSFSGVNKITQTCRFLPLLGRCQIEFEPFRSLVLLSFQEMINDFITAKRCINYL